MPCACRHRGQGECEVLVPQRGEAWVHMELCLPFLHLAGAAQWGGGGWQLCLISGIILSPLGNRDSLHPTSELTCAHCKRGKSTLLDLLWIYRGGEQNTPKASE